MTHHVQEFIESTIDLIEKKEYYEVFTMWYLHYYDGEGLGRDYQNLQELFKIFDDVEINLYRESEQYRIDIISEQMYDIIDRMLSTNYSDVSIELPNVLRQLKSRLGISLIQLNKIFKEVGKDIQRKHDVRIEPFKIVRNRKD